MATGNASPVSPQEGKGITSKIMDAYTEVNPEFGSDAGKGKAPEGGSQKVGVKELDDADDIDHDLNGILEELRSSDSLYKRDDAIINQVVCATNQYRKSRGLKPLYIVPTLSTIAQAHSQYMSKNKIATHSDPAGTLGTRLSKKGVKWQRCSENVATGFNDVKSVMNAWKASKDHNTNLLSPTSNIVGIGRVGIYWTQNFAQVADNAPINKYLPKC
ncbi:hypothetical protein AX774_g2178 [Zancudomyces culisetae]|uniref:SCP domain-containing protein n=1 Tax=Zancudomyces culisetae TaxID=1213189 RepID=A0A1R1PTR6_ZANCU|nr:hypothetical protein AX774_g2178 [Zancudomyces culisetae]|eukprot:OMH84303.1 hypothetical protein AX774_g2178 [Zancudomyces culisetae]